MSPGIIGEGPAPVPEWARQFMVPTRDKVHLATDVYLPSTGTGPFPTILVRLPYDKNSRYVLMEPVARRATQAGYAFVVQDVRGKFRSEGEALGLVVEADDGYDTLEWIIHQDWSNGDVGMFGDSYYGQTQWAALSSGHPALKALVPRVTSARLHERPPAEAPTADVPWLRGAQYFAECWAGPYINEVQIDYGHLPLVEAFEEAFESLGRRSHRYDLLFPHPIPLPIYRNGDPLDQTPIPVLHVVGWFDNLNIVSMRDYVRATSLPEWASLQFLYADATDHENTHLSVAPALPEEDHGLSDEALERLLDTYIDPALRFFDVFLKGDAPAAALPRVQWHLGHVGWRDSESWPPQGSTVLTLHLEGLEAASHDVGSLQTALPSRRTEARWRHDPDHLVPSLARDTFAFLSEYPDEQATGLRSDVLVFDGEVQHSAVDIAGPVDLWVRVGSTAPTTDLFARLLDVAPDGVAHLIRHGQAELRRPDAARELRIEMGHTGYRLKAGHRFRLLLCSSYYPEFSPSSGSGEDRWRASERHATEQWLASSPNQPARLTMTLLPASPTSGEAANGAF